MAARPTLRVLLQAMACLLGSWLVITLVVTGALLFLLRDLAGWLFTAPSRLGKRKGAA